MTTHRHRLARHRGGAANTGPWLRAPLLLLRHPAVFLGILAASAVLAVAAASGVLFVSTLDTASLQAQASADCPERSMPAFNAQVPHQLLPEARAAGVKAMRDTEPEGSVYPVEIGFATVQRVPVTFYSRPDVLEHVTKVSGPGGPGVWVPDSALAQFHVKPGGYLHTTSGRSVRVAGTYRSLAPSPFVLADIPPYFCNWSDLIIRRLGDHGVGPLLLADEATTSSAADIAQLSVYDKLPINDLSTSRVEQLDHLGDAASRSFHDVFHHASPAQDSPYASVPVADTGTLEAKIVRARASRAGVSGSVLPLDLAAVLVALLLVVGAGGFWATHRAREIRLLVARGVGPGALAGKAVLETAPAALLGLVTGSGAAVVLVRSVAPTSVLGPGAVLRSVGAAALALAVGLLVIAAIGAAASRERLVGGGRRWWVAVPWELLLGGVAVLIAVRLHSASSITVHQAIVHVRPALVIFPLLASLAVLLLAGRLFGLLVPLLRRRAGGGTARYLAVRRIAGSLGMSVAVVVCVGLPGALLTYTNSLTSSVRADVTAKYHTNLGAERVLDVVGNGPLDLHGLGTAVESYQGVPMLQDGSETYVLGVDPASFADYAFVSSAERAEVAQLTSRGAAIMINAPRGQVAARVQIGRTSLDVHVIGRGTVFPGLRAGAIPLLVVNRSLLDHVDQNVDVSDQAWTSPAHETVVRNLLAQQGYNVLAELQPDLVVDSTGLLPVTWIFSYLRALAIMIGVVAVVGLIFALAARTRRRTVSYVLSRRMGLTRAANLRTNLVELSVVVGLGFGLGIAVGLGALRVILGSLDVYPSLPPPPSLHAPTGVWLATGVGWVIVVIVAAVAQQLLAERAKPAEILRLE
ncbi:FtsX-like permease family protein [Jatrophihabitans sp.]|uniref:FtsX-like permease family protein n=1 Tax=Jatrophihabitans sp. TaxID=1932789 RepID=UPI0030C70C0F|nr:rane protein of unknown function [Jatrophihabitans sp.]